jgi:transposase
MVSSGCCDLALPGAIFPASMVPRTTCYNRFVRWRKAGVWESIMAALTAAPNAAVQMIDTSMVRVHQHAACFADGANRAVGRSRGGLTSKLHVVVDGKGLPLRLGITAGQTHDNRLCPTLLSGLAPRTMLLADRGYDAGGSGRSSTSEVLGPTFRRNAIGENRSASALIYIVRATSSKGSSTRSSIAVERCTSRRRRPSTFFYRRVGGDYAATTAPRAAFGLLIEPEWAAQLPLRNVQPKDADAPLRST